MIVTYCTAKKKGKQEKHIDGGKKSLTLNTNFV